MTNGTDKAVLDALQALNEGVRALGEDMRLVRGQIGEMHEDLRDVRLETVKHGMQIDHVDEKLEMLRESIMTALGFTTQVSVQQKKMAKQLSELVERIERLEKSK
jgi:uncharacterized protein (UPF0335 family)